MNIIDELEALTAYVQSAPARKRLAKVIGKLQADVAAEQAAQGSVKPRKRVTGCKHDAAVKAGRDARRAGYGKEGAQQAGTLQERNAWLAGWNDEDIKRGGK